MNSIKEQYELNRVPGRTSLDPRRGFYKIVSVNQGTCFGKPATMAVAYWKLYVNDIYTQTFTVQLESLKIGLEPLNIDNIVGREIYISEATWNPSLSLFAISWRILPLKVDTLADTLNNLLNNGADFDLDKLEY